MNVVFIIPTGIGAEIGGHAGDATPYAKMIASVCDRLFIHPNVVNASDLNEMTENMLYVEGSILDRFLEGQIGLEEVYMNKVLVVVNAPVTNNTINAVSGARAVMGADIEIMELRKPLRMVSKLKHDRATGEIHNLEEMIKQVSEYNFDVLVVNTPIETDDVQVKHYLMSEGGINVWGGVEAKLSKMASEKLNRPVIHAPVENSEVFKTFNEIVDPRKAAEMVSVCYLHCCLKGAHVAPKISMSDQAYWYKDIGFLVSPANLLGRPHLACVRNKIPIIYVRQNKTTINQNTPEGCIVVDNYLEVCGVIAARKAGISLHSIKRPIGKTKVIEGGQ